MNNTGFSKGDILVPNVECMSAWSVIACDQYTSQPQYWRDVENFVKTKPSTLNMMVPEIRFASDDLDQRICSVNRAMRTYLRPAVQVVGAVVDRKLVLLPSQGKSAPADAVGVAARHRAKAGGLPLIVLDAVAPQHDVPQLSLAVLHPGRDHRRAVVGQADRGSLRVCDGIQKGRAAVT